MTIVPPLPGTDPRATAVPLAGMSPRRRPDGLVGALAANVPVDEPPPPLELDVEPPDEPPDDPPPAGDAVPADDEPEGWECWASAVAGTDRMPARIAAVRYRVISKDESNSTASAGSPESGLNHHITPHVAVLESDSPVPIS